MRIIAVIGVINYISRNWLTYSNVIPSGSEFFAPTSKCPVFFIACTSDRNYF